MQKLDGERVEELIELVRINNILYDKNEELYRNNESKERIWIYISSQLNVSVSDCKMAWRSLRDQYRKNVKDSKKLSGEGLIRKKPYKYSEQLAFLKDSIMQSGETIRTPIKRDDGCEELEEIFLQETSDGPFANILDDTSESTGNQSSCSSIERKRFKESEEDYSQFLQKLNVINDQSLEKKHDGTHKFFEALADTVASFNLPPLELMAFENKIHTYSLQLLKEWQAKKK